MSRVYPRELLERAIALKATGLTWNCVAERVGRDPHVLQIVLCQYRRGQWNFRSEETSARNDEIERLFCQEGMRLIDIARRFSLTLGGVAHILTRRGIDAEARSAMRRGEDAFA